MTNDSDIAEQVAKYGCRQQTSDPDFKDEYNRRRTDSSQSVIRRPPTSQERKAISER